MDGFVLSQTEVDGECWVLAETTADVAGSPSCGVQATFHGRSVVQVRDLPTGGFRVRLVWRKRRWPCCDPDCPAKTFTEESPLVEGSLTPHEWHGDWNYTISAHSVVVWSLTLTQPKHLRDAADSLYFLGRYARH
jgi:transposase